MSGVQKLRLKTCDLGHQFLLRLLCSVLGENFLGEKILGELILGEIVSCFELRFQHLRHCRRDDELVVLSDGSRLNLWRRRVCIIICRIA